MADDKPIIIVKKKGHHGGHHGGAWKVAYADFVTAMMAFFMVMWLVNSAEVATRQNIASYFKRPGIFQQGSGTPLLMGEAGILTDAYTPPSGMRSKYKGKFAGPGYGDQRNMITEKIGSEPYDPELDGKERKGRGPGMGGTGVQEGAFPETDDTLPEWKKKETAVVWRKKGQTDEITVDIATTTEEKTEGEEGVVKTQGSGGNKGEKAEGVVKTQGKPDGKGGEQGTLEASGDKGPGTKQDRQALYDVAEELKRKIIVSQDLRDALGDVLTKVEADGLHIEVMDTAKTSMFAPGSAQVLPAAREAFAQVAAILKNIPNRIELVGHTDSKAFSSQRGGYSNWELSADRANAARRLLESAGLEPARFASVVGRADREPLLENDSLAPANRRITLRVRLNYTKPVLMESFEPLEEIGEPVPVSRAGYEEEEQIEEAQEIEAAPSEGEGEDGGTGVKITSAPKATAWKPKKMIRGKSEEKKIIALPDSNIEDTEPAAGADGKPNRAPVGGIFQESPIISSPGVLSGVP